MTGNRLIGLFLGCQDTPLKNSGMRHPTNHIPHNLMMLMIMSVSMNLTVIMIIHIILLTIRPTNRAPRKMTRPWQITGNISSHRWISKNRSRIIDHVIRFVWVATGVALVWIDLVDWHHIWILDALRGVRDVDWRNYYVGGGLLASHWFMILIICYRKMSKI